MERIDIVKTLLTADLVKIILFETNTHDTRLNVVRYLNEFIKLNKWNENRDISVECSVFQNPAELIEKCGIGFSITLDGEEFIITYTNAGFSIDRTVVNEIIDHFKGDHVVVVIDNKNSDNPSIFHVVVYENMPGFLDLSSLADELVNDEDFGCHDPEKIVSMGVMVYRIDVNLPDIVADILTSLEGVEE